MQEDNITVFDGDAKLAGTTAAARNLAVAMKAKAMSRCTAKNVHLATGPASPAPCLEADGSSAGPYREAWWPPNSAKSRLVIGSGASASNSASSIALMGSEVTVALGFLDSRILPLEDEEVRPSPAGFRKAGHEDPDYATVCTLKRPDNNVNGHDTSWGKSPEINRRSRHQRRRDRRNVGKNLAFRRALR